MTPREIAKKLTPAQVRALRDPVRCSGLDIEAFLRLPLEVQKVLSFTASVFVHGTVIEYSESARAVLAELDKGETHGQG